jgi:hypothetical protein
MLRVCGGTVVKVLNSFGLFKCTEPTTDGTIFESAFCISAEFKCFTLWKMLFFASLDVLENALLITAIHASKKK